MPINNISSRAYRTQPQGISRRSWFKLSMAGACASTFSLARPQAALATSKFKPGVGEVNQQEVSFRVFTPAVFSAELPAQAVMIVLSDYIINHRDLQLLPLDQRLARYLVIREHVFAGFAKIPGNPLKVPEPQNRDANTWNRVFYKELVHFLGQRGLILRIDFPVLKKKEAFAEESHERLAAHESYGLIRVESVESGHVDIWGERIEAPRVLANDEEDFVFRGVNLALEVDSSIRFNAASTLYGNIVLFKSGRTSDSAHSLQTYADSRTLPDQIRGHEWEEHVMRPSKYSENPLHFSMQKLLAGEVEDSFTPERLRTCQEIIKLAHESWHLRDYRKFRFKSGLVALNSWETYISDYHSNFFDLEFRGYLTELRAAPDDFRRAELRFLIDAALVTQEPEKKDADLNPVFLSIIDRFIDHVDRNVSLFPQIKLLEHPTLNRRKQIAGQLYRLTPAEIGTVTEGVFKTHDEEYTRKQLRPVPTNLQELYAGPLYRRTVWEDHGPWIKPLAMIGGPVVLVVGGLLFKARRQARLAREARLRSIYQIFVELKVTANAAQMSAFARAFLAKPLSKRKTLQELAKHHGIDLPAEVVGPFLRKLQKIVGP